MLSCCAFAQADLNIFVSRSWQFYRSKHRHSLMNNGNSDQGACGMMNGKKNANYVPIRRFNFDSACAGLSVCAANINLCGGQRTNPLMTNLSTRRHLGMCTVINFIKNKQTKKDSVVIPLRILPRIFYKIIIIIYANMHVTIT